MNGAQYRKVQNAVGIVSISLAAFSLFAILVIIVTEPSLRSQIDRKGLLTFFEMFDSPLKLLGAAFAAFIVWVTLGRITQTERQIDAIVDNNLFNNYYKHIEEFNKYFSIDPLVSGFCKLENIDHRIVLLPVYKLYYYESYRNFVPHLSLRANQFIDAFTQALYASLLNNHQTALESVPLALLETISGTIDETIHDIVTPVTQQHIPTVKNYLNSTGLNLQQINTEVARFEQINLIYWTNAFYRSLLAFDGVIEQPAEQFTTNYGNYLDYLGLLQ